MLYWIAGYLLGMSATAALMAWAKPGLFGYTPRQICVAGLLVLFWPPWLAVVLCVFMLAFFHSLFQPKPKRSEHA
ncbi:hypothetical protein LCGC14_1577870 [marine sediment metagenome]|uniref:Uncharacterized protein n=1 Tax=marine sediment metagenome TaxID=412755 RepID=A0A0F9IHR3_9ZZZZ